MLYDGWVIRFAEGYTKRANSVNPLYASSIDVEEKIRFCEALYRKRNLPVVFKMTSAASPAGLDETLQAKGYQIDSATSVQTIDLTTGIFQAASEAEFQEELSDTWLENYCRMNAVPAKHQKTLQGILLNILPDRCFASIRSEERVVACGLGVLQSGHVGLFDIVTDPEFRQRGYGQKVVTSILGWGKQKDAHTGYLQVMLHNTPALRLYSKIGFTEQYQYWYRIRS
jgi:ribosomal protein S18 acetylase RimI-like enzyme